MVKADSKRINVRLRTPVRFALEELMERWGLGMTAALERAILEAHSGGDSIPQGTTGAAVKRSPRPWDEPEYDEGREPRVVPIEDV